MTDTSPGTAPSSDEGGAVPCFWDVFIREAVGPFVLEVPGDDDEVVEWEVPYPSADAVAALDVTYSDQDILYLLMDDDDTTDTILDLYEDLPISELQEAVDDIRAHYGILTPSPYGWAQLMKDFRKYGEDLERDAVTEGLDLYDWVRHHEELPWAKLYRVLLDRAREGGYVEAARLLDEELALEQVKAETEGKKKGAPKPRPSVVGWTRDRENGERATELLEQLVHAVWAASPKFKGKGGKRPSGHARPELAYNKVKRYALYVEHDEIASMLLGSRHKPLDLEPLWETGRDELDEDEEHER